MTEPIAPDDMMPTQPEAAVDAVVATLDSTEPMPAVETAQEPRMFGEFDAPFVLVLGLGESGLAMARWCARHGARVRVADTREAPANLPTLRAHVPDAEFVSGPFAVSLLDGATLVVISPGLSPLDANVAALLAAANERAVPVWGEIELFARALAGLKAAQGYTPRVLAITGTNGKTTTTALTGALVERAGKTVGVAGNISPSALDKLTECVDAGTLPDVWVLELSSFQLETTHTLDADAATILNITQDHLDWHGTMQAYAAAKGRIFGANTVRVLNRQDAGVMAFASKKGGDITFGIDEPGTPEALGLLREGGMPWIVLAEADEDDLPKPTRRKKGDTTPAAPVPVRLKRLMPADALRIRGRHNAINALSALALATGAGCTLAPLLYGLREALACLFEEGLENVYHRHAVLGEATRQAVAAWGLKTCAKSPEWNSDTVTAILAPEGVDAAKIIKHAYVRYNLALGAGLSQVAGKVFRIGHVGDLNELSLLGAIAGAEMSLLDNGVKVTPGSGVAAASSYLRENPLSKS